MAKKKKDKTLWLVLLLAGGGAAIWYFTRPPAAATIPIAPGLPAVPGAITPPPVALPPSVPSVTTTGASTTAIAPVVTRPTAAGYDPRMDTMQAWAEGGLNPCDLARWNANKANFSPDEWAGLFDIYFQDWQGGQGNTAARTQFWDAWRVKYSILTNQPC